MCGLISVIGKITPKEEKIFRQGLIVDVLRGEHSTGVAVVRRGVISEPIIAKQVGNPFELFNDRRYETAMAGSNRVLIGHNRYATQGRINKYNAHPFNYGHVYGAHNGTLSYRLDLEDNAAFEVDSKALYNHIAEHGVEDAISKVRGAWALTWWDDEQGTFNVLRNSERTLYTATCKATKVKFFASEAEMLLLILNRNNVSFDEITLLAEDTWYAFPVSKEGEIGEPTTKQVKGKAPAPVVVPQRPAYTHTHTGYSAGVIGSNRVFEVMGKASEGKFGHYFTLLSVDYEGESFRLYPLKDDPNIYVKGQIIVADVIRFVGGNKPYYVLSPVNNREATEDEEAQYDVRWSKVRGEVVGETKLDHRGNAIPLDEWEDQYHTCDWCTSSIDPRDEGTLLSQGGNVFCSSCASNPDITNYLN